MTWVSQAPSNKPNKSSARTAPVASLFAPQNKQVRHAKGAPMRILAEVIMPENKEYFSLDALQAEWDIIRQLFSNSHWKFFVL
jgi:glucose-6-phosphate 1-dehydrogenase